MTTKKLTSAAVEKTPPPASGRLEIWDSLLPGLVLRVTSNGAKSFAVMTRVNGRRTRVTLGRYPALKLDKAREKARKVLEQASEGKDPRKPRGTNSTTVSAMAADFIAKYARSHTRARTAKEYDNILRREVIPAWGNRDVADIRKRDVVLLVEAIRDRGAPYAANRTLAVVRKMFRWLAQRDIIDVAPTTDVAAPAAEKRRDRVLSDAEVRAIWIASGELNTIYRDWVRVVLQRRQEVATMCWGDIDAENVWTIPADATKSGRTHTVPLSDQAVQIINNMLRIESFEEDEDSDYVFTTNGKTPISGFSKLKASIDEAIEAEDAKPLPPWRLHDLRRTAATGMARLGVTRVVISRVLNHAEAGVTAIYERHTYDPEKRQALTTWANHVERVIDGVTNVVPLRA